MSDFDVIIVGAGPAGASAALVAARGGLRTALLERGPYPGAKNLMGGVLYTDVLAELVPEFREAGAPLERHICKKGLSVLSDRGETSASFRTSAWDEPPHNHSYTVLRSRFDRWYAQQAEGAGAEVISGVVVDRTLKDDAGRVVGVSVRVPEGQPEADGHLAAPLVILADGANSLLVEADGLRPPLDAGQAALGVKETLGLERQRLEDRFGVRGDQGVAWEYLGASTAGLPGAGFLYTNRDTLSVGVVVYAADLAASSLTPVEILDQFKAHPAVEPLVRDSELLEYGAHLIPESGYDHLPQLARDGLLLVGDAAGLVSTSPQHEGSNYAMASGKFAAEAALEAHRKGDFSAATLSCYRRSLEESFVLQNMEHYRDWPAFVASNPHLFRSWPNALTEMAEALLRIGGGPKSERGNELWDLFQRRVGVLPAAMTGLQLRNALRILGYGKSDKILDYLAKNW